MDVTFLQQLTQKEPLFAALPLGDIQAVCDALSSLPNGSKLQFLLSHRGSLGGISVAEALQKGMLPKVLAAAEAFVNG